MGGLKDMAKYGFVVDVAKCNGCHNCFIMCKDEFDRNDYLPLSVAQPAGGQDWIRVQEVEQGSGSKLKVDYITIMCQHCEDALCMKAGPAGAVYRRDDGIVIIDPVKAKGHKEIALACPYRAISWNEEKQLAQKCTMCAHMLDSGETTTRCAEACPTGALIFGDMDNPNSDIAKFLAANKDKVEDFLPELEVKPRVKYVGLPKIFIAGEVLLADKPKDCLKGAKVTLKPMNNEGAMVTTTDFFGDFEFKGLAKNQEYVLTAEYEGYAPVEVTVRTNVSKNLDVITLVKK